MTNKIKNKILTKFFIDNSSLNFLLSILFSLLSYFHLVLYSFFFLFFPYIFICIHISMKQNVY